MENFSYFKRVLFLDIETVPMERAYEDLDNEFQELWDKKSLRIDDDQDPAVTYRDRGAIYSEFGKIIVISIGFLHHGENNEISLRVTSLHNSDEKVLLTDFKNMINRFPSNTLLCGHNSKEFDFPYICRRMLINGIEIPSLLDISGKKPWEIQHLDTMELWKFGDRKSYTSLNLLAKIFGIKSSKEMMDGSQVYEEYYENDNLYKIAEYCAEDVIATAQVFLRLHCKATVDPQNISVVTSVVESS